MDDDSLDQPPPAVGDWGSFAEDAKKERNKTLLIVVPVALLVLLAAGLFFLRSSSSDDPGPTDAVAIDPSATTTTFQPPSSLATTTSRAAILPGETTITVAPVTTAPGSTTAATGATTTTKASTTTTKAATTTTTLTPQVNLQGTFLVGGAGSDPPAATCEAANNYGWEMNRQIKVFDSTGRTLGETTLFQCNPAGAAQPKKVRWTMQLASVLRARAGSSYLLYVCGQRVATIAESKAVGYSVTDADVVRSTSACDANPATPT